MPWKTRASACFLFSYLLLIDGCHRPASDAATLEAVGTEAFALLQRHDAASRYVDLPRRDWPPVITRLRPERVVVHSWGVDIVMKRYFDGGWGYHVGARQQDLPMPAACYSRLIDGVFWHGPC